MLALVVLLMVLTRRGARRPRRLWLGLALLLPTTVVLLNVGYLGQTSFASLGRMAFSSTAFLSAQHLLPGLRLPLPDAYLAGFDFVLFESLVGAARSMHGRGPGRRTLALIGVVLALAQAAETARAAPWYLSFFNAASGGPGGGYRLLNDANVDWGQGLIALKDELRRRGIGRMMPRSSGQPPRARVGRP